MLRYKKTLRIQPFREKFRDFLFLSAVGLVSELGFAHLGVCFFYLFFELLVGELKSFDLPDGPFFGGAGDEPDFGVVPLPGFPSEVACLHEGLQRMGEGGAQAARPHQAGEDDRVLKGIPHLVGFADAAFLDHGYLDFSSHLCHDAPLCSGFSFIYE